MGRIWNVLGWLTIASIVPGMIYATTGGGENEVYSHSHASTCRTCSLCQGNSPLPDVIDGDNLFVVNPGVSATHAEPNPEAGGRLVVARTGQRSATIPPRDGGRRSRRVVPRRGT
jgi:hypothetical protein